MTNSNTAPVRLPTGEIVNAPYASLAPNEALAAIADEWPHLDGYTISTGGWDGIWIAHRLDYNIGDRIETNWPGTDRATGTIVNADPADKSNKLGNGYVEVLLDTGTRRWLAVTEIHLLADVEGRS